MSWRSSDLGIYYIKFSSIKYKVPPSASVITAKIHKTDGIFGNVETTYMTFDGATWKCILGNLGNFLYGI